MTHPRSHAPTGAPHPRFDSVDALRGMAMVWMTVFHLCFDLSHFGYWPQNFRTDPFWTGQRTVIVSMFLFCAGLGQAIALHQGQGWRRFGHRWMQIAAGALLVSVSSFAMFPQSFIYFGVLHGMAVMLLLTRFVAKAPLAWWWLAGAAAIAMPWLAQYWLAGVLSEWAPYCNARALNWLGLVTRKPYTEDYVPVLPWLGVLWWGMACGRWMLLRRPAWLGVSVPALLRPLALLGRWSLVYYLAHQPVLIGLLLAWRAWP